MQMFDVQVFSDEENVFIKQDLTGGQHVDVVQISPEQVPLLVKWLEIAAKECEQRGNA